MNHPDDDTPADLTAAAPADAPQAEAKPVRRRRAPKAELPAGEEAAAAPAVEASEEAPAKPARKRRAAAAKPAEGAATTIHSVLAIPHADLALALDQKRAAELLKSLAEPSGTTPTVTGNRPETPPEWADLADSMGLGKNAKLTDLTDAHRTTRYQAAIKEKRVERLKGLQENVNRVRVQAQGLYNIAVDALRQDTCRSPGATRNGWSGHAPRDLTDHKAREDIIADAATGSVRAIASRRPLPRTPAMRGWARPRISSCR